MDEVKTLLDAFLSVARNPSTIEDPVLECGTEQWTYGDLDCISSGLALKIHQKCGLKPVIAVISENHPFVLAILLATWKLGGIFAPFDCHSPLEMVEKMLENTEATCAVVPDFEDGLNGLLDKMQIPKISYSKNTTITSLTQLYLAQVAEISPSLYPPPDLASLAAYIHTSSASSISNLKCVQLTHESIAYGCRSVIKWFHRAWPSVNFDKLRVLGIAPWSHIMALSYDFGAATFGTGGCYVFGVPPSGYAVGIEVGHVDDSVSGKAEEERDILDRLVDAAVKTRPDVLVAVPWVLEGFKERYTRLLGANKEAEAFRVKHALQALKCLGSGGAAMSAEMLSWIKELRIDASSNIGMTELGGGLFHRKIDLLSTPDHDDGWSLEDCFFDDVQLVLVDEDGTENDQEGELIITTRHISRGYLKYDNSAFSFLPDGSTTFRTGDVYERKSDGRFIWKGRKDDYIQTASGETLDPRPIEKALSACQGVLHCCVVGNNFMRKASDAICILIEPAVTADGDSVILTTTEITQITKTLAAMNRGLLPPLRIPWSRVVVLEKGMKIPYTRKGMIFRKKLESLFGDVVLHLLEKDDLGYSALNGEINYEEDKKPAKLSAPGIWKTEDVKRMTVVTISSILRVGTEALRAAPDTTFAEFGMDSNMAVRIVNELNSTFSLHLPLNACHTSVDLQSMCEAIMVELGIKGERQASSGPRDQPTTTNMKEEVVIVGQALRLPGDINTPDAFWEALINKRNDIMIPVPPDRWDHASFYRSPTSLEPPQIGDINFEKAGFVDVAHFDNAFFGISTPEAFFVSPSVRLTLETAFEALENANIPISKVKGTSMGAFVAAGLNEGYTHVLFTSLGWEAYKRTFGTGTASSTACGRLSYLLDIHGPSMTTDTACSSGLVAFDQAVKYIQSGGGESAMVSAASTALWPGSFGFLSANKMASVNSRCATFTTEADGYVPSEGCVAFVLKSKTAALRDGDNILAIVKSTEVMHGGKSQGLVSPNVKTQIALQRSLLVQAGLQPSEIAFLEAHGTGTSLGDLIEIQGINEVFKYSHTEDPLILGASKSCIGHTEMASGLVGLLSAIASLKYGVVPGLVHLNEHNLNPSINCDTVPLHIPHEVAPLPRMPETPCRGLVLWVLLPSDSQFWLTSSRSNGFAGTLAGAIIEGPGNALSSDLQNKQISALDVQIPMPFVVSAKTPERLCAYLEKYIAFCRNLPPSDFVDLCFTTCVGREHYRYRFACVAHNLPELIANLESRLHEMRHNAQGLGTVASPRVASAFPGQGSQFRGMASELADHFPDFKEIISALSAKASQVSGYDILSFLLDKDSPCEFPVNEGRMGQISIFVFQYSLSSWLRSLGIEPFAVLGHSLGEIAATVTAGAMDYAFALKFVVRRAEILCPEFAQSAGMALIAASEETILQRLHELGLDDQLSIAVCNGPNSHAVSGTLSAVNSLVTDVKAQAIRATKLNVTQGFHSPSIYPYLPVLEAWLADNQQELSPLKLPMYSTVYGRKISADSELATSYWIEHAKNPVEFYRAVRELENDKDLNIILDIGPQPFIWTTLQTLQHHKATISTSTKQSQSQNLAFLRGIALLFEQGVTPNFEKLLQGSRSRGRKISVPTYPFQKQRHYPECIPSRSHVPKGSTVDRVLEFPIDQGLFDLLADHLIQGHRVVPAAYLIDFFANKAPSGALQSISFHLPLVLESYDLTVNAEINGNSRFLLYNSDSSGQHVCSGILGSRVPPVLKNRVRDHPPQQIKDTADVYASFKNVQFGPSFRNVQEIRTWSTHADALIAVHSAAHRAPSLDRIRKLDACLHSLGAIITREVPQVRELDGAFLPSSLEGFSLYSDDLPESFVCRYYLPVDVARNYHVISAAFDVFSEAGELLVSCKKYSVAWIPTGVTIQKSERNSGSTSEAQSVGWWRQIWVNKGTATEGTGFSKYDQLLVICPTERNSRIASFLPALSTQFQSLHLSASLANGISKEVSLPDPLEDVIQKFKDSPAVIMLDLTSIDALPMTEAFTSCYRLVLRLMQLLSSHKIDIRDLVVISTTSVAADVPAGQSAPEVEAPSVAALVQGMMRVFRRETGSDDQIWALDLPRLDTISGDALRHLLLSELEGRQRGKHTDRAVAYRRRDGQEKVERLVPIFESVKADEEVGTAYHGVAVITGLGSIGASLAQPMIMKGSSKVVYIGRRPVDDTEVQMTLHRLESEIPGRTAYVQADVCELDSLKSAISHIQAAHGPIGSIIHSAAVISDATIQNIDLQSFETVIRPKVVGAWNLHILTEELCPTLASFVLLSSISVSLGNPGQAAYAAANHYMEVLASYRRGKNLPATALQLGPWESKLTQNLDTQDSLIPLMDNKRGIPLIISAMSKPDSVQMIANLDARKLAAHPVYSRDPLFHSIVFPEQDKLAKTQQARSDEEISTLVANILRKVLELRPSEKLELEDSLTICGVDSISFAQVRGRILHELMVEVPMMFLSDTFTIHEMIAFVIEKYSSRIA
ncbi:hypothetical protein CVT26_002801 [Gymnopilus dilepis]|uniref:Uncharacterized protein n=1 Tax=Gymnopilus dilepis TaxID=231916 RepID=A0A409Y3A0_9AGAR|nr:hypothetical protein CVT26_002801 [Gymnopilus dilepis]